MRLRSGLSGWWALLVAAGPAAAGPACDAALSDAQRQRFAMALAACSVPGAAAAPARQADALVATEPLPAPQPAARESAHLQLFQAPGLVAARIAEPSAVAARPAAAAPAKSRRTPAPKAVSRAVALAPHIDEVARRHDVDPLLLHAIAHVESRHDPAAVSPAGARGVMQVMPATGARFGVGHAGGLHHLQTNLEIGAAYLKTLQARFGTNLPLVLAAYNAGEGAVERNGRRIPPYRETQNYVRQVLDQYRSLTAAAQALPPAVPAAAF